jgi:asparagine synthase (glutamine-hydrolysing)
MPIGSWLRGPLRPWASDLLSPELIRRQGYLRPEPIQKLWHEYLAGHADHTPRLWTVLMWQAWPGWLSSIDTEEIAITDWSI